MCYEAKDASYSKLYSEVISFVEKLVIIVSI